MTRVVVGCPTRHRGHLLPRWCDAVRKGTVAAALLANDDPHFVAQKDALLCVRPELYGWLRFMRVTTGEPGWHRIAPRYNMANLARLRNVLVDFVHAVDRDFTHFWSCDSDVIPDAGCLEKLLALDVPVAAAVVENGNTAWNFIIGDRRNASEPGALRAGEPFRVAMTGACYLIRRDVLDAGVRYGDNPRGEDFEFCRSAREKGFDLWVVPGATTQHLMEDVA